MHVSSPRTERPHFLRSLDSFLTFPSMWVTGGLVGGGREGFECHRCTRAVIDYRRRESQDLPCTDGLDSAIALDDRPNPGREMQATGNGMTTIAAALPHTEREVPPGVEEM